MGQEGEEELRGWGRIEEAGREGTRRLPNGQHIPTPLVHRSNEDFRKDLDKIPPEIQVQARERHRLLEKEPGDLRLNLKCPFDPIWRVEVGHGYRAVGIMPPENQGLIIWFAILPHAPYERLLDGFREDYT